MITVGASSSGSALGGVNPLTGSFITGTIHTLPFDKLAPRDFERLCLWLVEREGYQRAEHLGAAGNEQGRDVIAWRQDLSWAFQCKRVKQFGPSDALAEIDKILSLPNDQRPAGLIFIVTCDVSAQTRQQARERCGDEMECDFWAETEIDAKVKRHPDLLQEFFRATVIYEGTKPVSMGNLLDACRTQVTGVLYDVRHKYDPDLYVKRAIEQELNEFFDSSSDDTAPDCFVLVAPAGSGKTNLLCDLARTRVNAQPVLLLMGGNIYLAGDIGLVGVIQTELEAASPDVVFRSSSDALHTLHRLAEDMGGNALILLDAINEYERPARMRKAIADLLRKTRGKRIKLAITCRDYYWGLFKDDFWLESTVNRQQTEACLDEDSDPERDFSRFAKDEYEQALVLYLKYYEITGRPVGDAADQCRHPLLLRFFCEAYRGQDIGFDEVADIRLKELFDRYWDRKLDSIAGRMRQQGAERLHAGLTVEVGNYLLDVAAYMLHNATRAIPLQEMSLATSREEQYDDPRSIYGRIRDEYIILEEKVRSTGQRRVRQVVFVYEEFMEYTMARSLICDWNQAGLNEASILIKIEELTSKCESFAQIVGVMVYLALMLKEKHGLALWPLLLGKGERWQRTVFEAFRKLPQSQVDAGVFAALEEMWITGDEDVRKQVLDTLKVKRVGQRAPASMVFVLCDVAKSAQESLARRAVLALGSTTMINYALPPLVQALESPWNSIRRNAVIALARLGEPAIQSLVLALGSEHEDVRGVASEMLVDQGRLAVKPLVIALRSSNEGTRAAASETLVALGELAIPALIACLSDTDVSVRLNAIGALGQLGDKRAVEPIASMLQDAVPAVRRSAAEVLGRWREGQALERLILALRDPDDSVRLSAVRALGRIGSKEITRPVIAVLRDHNASVRQEAAVVLGQLGDASASEPLIRALYDHDISVQQAAARALGTLGDDQAVEPLIAILTSPHASVLQTAARTLGILEDQRAVRPLLRVLKESSDVTVRQAAAQALGRLGDKTVVEPLLEILNDAHAPVRQAAADALGMLMDKRAIEPLVAAIKDDDVTVQLSVIGALGKAGDEQASDCLKTMLKHDSPQVRLAALQALGQVWQLQCITQLGSPDPKTRALAARALGKQGDSRAVEPLIVLLGDGNPETRTEAAEALINLGGLTVESLISAINHRDALVRVTAVELLGRLRDQRAVLPLTSALEGTDWFVWSKATAALGRLGDSAIQPLVRALRRPNKDVQQRIAQALERLGLPAVEPLIALLYDCGVDTAAQAWQEIIAGWGLRAADSDRIRRAENITQGGQVVATDPSQGQYAVAGKLVRVGSNEATCACRDFRYRQKPEGNACKHLLALAMYIEACSHPNIPPGEMSINSVLARRSRPAPGFMDKNASVCRSAIEILGKLKDKRAVPPVISALWNTSAEVRRAAADALGQLEDGRAIEPLILVLGDSREQVRRSAADALAVLEDSWVVGPITVALEHRLGSVREGAKLTLGELADKPLAHALMTTLEDPSENAWRSTIDKLRSLGESTASSLATVLEKRLQSSRDIAKPTFGKTEATKVADLLVATVYDHSKQTCRAAARALWGLEESSADSLVTVMLARYWWAGDAALKDFENCDDPSLAPIVSVLRQGNELLVCATVEALGRMARLAPLDSVSQYKSRRKVLTDST
jgi:HEAT repeat protein